ncbi:MAG: nucleotidyltransferase domain-containing protein [Candidatus Bathyarchaeia archaeon]
MFLKEKLKKEAYEKVKEFMKQVKPLKPKLIILYGSYARGDFTELSDIDVCIVAENLPENIFERRSLAGLYKVKNLRPIGYYPNEFLEELRKPNLFLYDIIDEGITFYDNGFMNEVKRIQKEELKKRRIVKNCGKWIIV